MPRRLCRRAWDAEYIACDDRYGDRQLDCHGTSRDRAALDGLRCETSMGIYRRRMDVMRSVGSWDASSTNGTAGRQGTRCAFDVHYSIRLYKNGGPPIIHLIILLELIILQYLLWCF